MVQSPLANQARITSQSSSRQGATVDTMLWHHQAGTNDDSVIDAMVSGSRGVSANYTIRSDGRLTLVVPEELRAWTSGSPDDSGRGAAWDRRSITVEIENETGGPEWRISDAAIATAAALTHDVEARYGRKMQHLGHRDLYTPEHGYASYPTYCPGPDTVARIVAAYEGGGDSGINPEEYDMKSIYSVPDLFYVTPKKNTGRSVWVIVGEPTNPQDVTLRVTQDEAIVNQILRNRGKDVNSIADTPFQMFANAVLFEFGFDARAVGQGTLAGLPKREGSALVDGFTWGKELTGGPGGVFDDTALRGLIDHLDAKISAIKVPTPAEFAKAVNDDASRRLQA